jgi:acetyl/propionyl-CoA carboxylase alpha subunit
MNTRLQVEHPVSEWVTGVDLVAWQLLLAAGEFQFPEHSPSRKGCALEVRLYAEDPRTFLPAPGPIGAIQFPSGAFLRSDTAFTEAGEVSQHYDPMIAKLSVWGQDRAEAVGRLRVALDEVRVEPPKRRDGTKLGSLRTNLPFLRRLVRNEKVIEGDTPTDLIANHPQLTSALPTADLISKEAAIALSLFELIQESPEAHAQAGAGPSSMWSWMARREGVRP